MPFEPLALPSHHTQPRPHVTPRDAFACLIFHAGPESGGGLQRQAEVRQRLRHREAAGQVCIDVRVVDKLVCCQRRPHTMLCARTHGARTRGAGLCARTRGAGLCARTHGAGLCAWPRGAGLGAGIGIFSIASRGLVDLHTLYAIPFRKLLDVLDVRARARSLYMCVCVCPHTCTLLQRC